MKKDADEKKAGQEEFSLGALLKIGLVLFGAKEPSGQDRLNETDRAIKEDSKNDEDEPSMGAFFKKVIKRRDEAKKREELQILDSLEYPGGKRVH